MAGMQRFREQARLSRGIRARAAWSPESVVLDDCGPKPGATVDLATADEVVGWQEWKNNNPGPTTDGIDHGHAFVRARIVIGGEPIPVTIDTNHPYRRQVNDATYELMIGPESATHTIDWVADAADVPRGANMAYGVNVLDLHEAPLGEF